MYIGQESQFDPEVAQLFLNFNGRGVLKKVYQEIIWIILLIFWGFKFDGSHNMDKQNKFYILFP